MKKLLTAMILISAMCANTVVFASDIDDILKDISSENGTYTEEGKYYIDENGEIQQENSVSIAIDSDYSEIDIIKLYGLKDREIKKQDGSVRYGANRITEVLEKYTSVYDCIAEDDWEYWLLLRNNGKVTGISRLFKGKPYSEAEEEILAREDIGEEKKNALLQTAKLRADKWYTVDWIDLTEYKKSDFLDMPQIEQKLVEKGITDIEDIKYVFGEMHINYLAIVKAKSGEYIIPFTARTAFKDITNGEVYTTEEMKQFTADVDEQIKREKDVISATPKPSATPSPTEAPEETDEPASTPNPTEKPKETEAPVSTPVVECSEWAKDDIQNAIANKILTKELQSGYTEDINRADFCRIAYNMLNVNGKADNIGSGVHFDDISIKEVYALSGMGIINGKGDNKFAPEDKITREEAAAILSRMIAFLNITDTQNTYSFYADGEEISDWAREDVYKVQKYEIMQGVDGGKFAPKDGYTKEQAVTTIMRVMSKIK